MGLSTEGKEIMENGSHEANVYYLLGEKGEFQDKILVWFVGSITNYIIYWYRKITCNY